jgi:hypothetical protein
MKCRFCDGKTRRVSNAQRSDGRHRWYRCYECEKLIHTIETYVVRGPVPGTPKKGAAARGSRNAAAIFTEEDILRMRKMAADGVLQKDIAVTFGIRPSSVSRIVNRKAWTHI